MRTLGGQRAAVPLVRALLAVAIVALVVAGWMSASGSPVVAQLLGATRATESPAQAAPATTTVVIRKFEFTPDRLTVPAGSALMVVNEDGVIHTLTALDGSFDTGQIPARQVGRCTAPTRPGTYAFRDSVLPFMTGTLVVTRT